MKQYAILLNPGHNRVYFKQSMNLAVSELTVASQKMNVTPKNIECKKIAGIEYLTFSTENSINTDDLSIISFMSFIYSIFEVVEIGGEKFLKPIEKPGEYFIDESISSILKYTGKTNEIFTRMMINTAYYTQDNTQNIKLLDPVAGKGTTLYEGLIRGFDVFGVEIGDKIVSEAYNYMKKFLETEKYKHTSEIIKISGANKSFSSKKYSFEIARTKEEQKTDKFKHFEIISGNSTYAGIFFKKNFFDIIVGDLPYGVQHGNVTNQKQSSLTRNPAELLEKCMPAWAGVLKPGGAIALAWNSNVLHRDKLVKIFTGCDLMVKDAGAYLGFGHRVDQAILRDIIVACKK